MRDPDQPGQFTEARHIGTESVASGAVVAHLESAILTRPSQTDLAARLLLKERKVKPVPVREVANGEALDQLLVHLENAGLLDGGQVVQATRSASDTENNQQVLANKAADKADDEEQTSGKPSLTSLMKNLIKPNPLTGRSANDPEPSTASAKQEIVNTLTTPSFERAKSETANPPDPKKLVLFVGQGKVVRLPTPMTKIYLGDPNVADIRGVEKDHFYLFGDTPGRTNVIATDANQQEVMLIDLEVVPDIRIPAEVIERRHPDAEVTFEPVGDGFLAEGLISDVSTAVDIAALGEAEGIPADVMLNDVGMDSAQQINIRVRFVEVARTDTFRFGINWQALIDSGDLVFGVTSGSAFLSGANSIATGELFGSANFGDFDLDLLIDGLQQEGLVNVLAEPNLTALNGEEASFLAGGEIPLPTPQGVSGSVGVEFKPFGVSLGFLPTILPGGRINLRVQPEVSELIGGRGLDINGVIIPALSVRRTDTSVALASGQTLAIAGMFQRNISNDIAKFPILGDIPILGEFFQSKRYQRSETELVILITPYLVKPTSDPRLVTPGNRARDLDRPFTPTRAQIDQMQARLLAEERSRLSQGADQSDQISRTVSPTADPEVERLPSGEATSSGDAGFIVY